MADGTGWGLGFKQLLDSGVECINTAAQRTQLEELHRRGAVDTTHLNARGSLVIARLVVDERRKLVPELAPLVRDTER